jgi:radical SAM superfamily enzyme YgiQ (UPF0313 family)
VKTCPSHRPTRLLLINPALPESFWSFRWWIAMVPGKRAINSPLGLATVAALCPPDWQVTIVDENVASLPLAPEADLIGVCGMGVQLERQLEILRYYRARGYGTVVGGSYASLCPEHYTGLADWIVAGEAEYIWPRFCLDYQAGHPQPLYRERGEVDLRDSPTPRYDLLDLDRYASISMQFSRGCPYRCEFCDIIVMFGRKPRTKTPEQIGRELDVLRARGVRSVFFVDDNLIGNRRDAKAMLRFLADYQSRHDYRLAFSTEVSLNLAQDEELLQLLRQAGFGSVFIGLESPDAACLQETGKTQNLRGDMLHSIQTIYRHGIDVLAGFIIGFDHDTPDTFERQYRFIDASGIQVAMVGLLTALPHTPLYQRLEQEGRLISPDGQLRQGDNTKPVTNVLPKGMGYQELVEGYEELFRQLFHPSAIARRIRHKMRHLRRPLPLQQYSKRTQLLILGRLLWRGILPGGPLRLLRFLHTLGAATVAAWPQVITDWIAGLSMRHYMRHHFAPDVRRAERVVQRTAAWLRRRYAASVEQSSRPEVHTGVSSQGAAELQLTLRGHLGRLFPTRAVRHLERLLSCSATRLTLRIEALGVEQHQQIADLLERLRPYGHRVSIWAHEPLRSVLSIDSSTFHLFLEEPRIGCPQTPPA